MAKADATRMVDLEAEENNWKKLLTNPTKYVHLAEAEFFKLCGAEIKNGKREKEGLNK